MYVPACKHSLGSLAKGKLAFSERCCRKRSRAKQLARDKFCKLSVKSRTGALQKRDFFFIICCCTFIFTFGRSVGHGRFGQLRNKKCWAKACPSSQDVFHIWVRVYAYLNLYWICKSLKNKIIMDGEIIIFPLAGLLLFLGPPTEF